MRLPGFAIARRWALHLILDRPPLRASEAVLGVLTLLSGIATR